MAKKPPEGLFYCETCAGEVPVDNHCNCMVCGAYVEEADKKAKPKNKPEKYKYTYTMHITETVESKCVIKSKRKLPYAKIEKLAEACRVEGETTSLGVSDVKMFLEEAKPGGSAAIAR